LIALKLKKHPMAKEMWDALIAEVTKKSKMVLTNLQRQLRNIKYLKHKTSSQRNGSSHQRKNIVEVTDHTLHYSIYSMHNCSQPNISNKYMDFPPQFLDIND
jgi:hypothetical protein